MKNICVQCGCLTGAQPRPWPFFHLTATVRATIVAATWPCCQSPHAMCSHSASRRDEQERNREEKLKPVVPLQFRHLMWKVLQTVCILRENKTVSLATFSFGLPLLPAPVNTLLAPCQFLLTSKLSPSHKTLLYCCAIRANALG